MFSANPFTIEASRIYAPFSNKDFLETVNTVSASVCDQLEISAEFLSSSAEELFLKQSLFLSAFFCSS